MSVFESVESDIAKLGPAAQGSGLAAAALALAAELDGQNSATSKSMCAKALIDTLRELRALAPPREEKDDLSTLRAERERRRSAAAKDSASS